MSTAAFTPAAAYAGTAWASGATVGAVPAAMWMQKLSCHGWDAPWARPYLLSGSR